ncbi:MAG: glycosyltransferase family 9 protein [Pyrinomonadaceae bacterium]
MNILIIKLGSIGDIVHTLPALSGIRGANPDAKIAWVAERRSAEILRGNPMIDKLIEVDTRALRGAKAVEEIKNVVVGQVVSLRGERFDVSLDFQGLLKSSVIGKLSGATRRWGFSRKNLREPSSRIFLTDTVKIPEKTHIVRKNLMLAEQALGISVPGSTFDFPLYTTGEHRREALGILKNAGERFAVLNPAGGWVTKLWHAEKFGQLADRLWDDAGITSVVVTGPNENELAGRVQAASGSGKLLLAEPSLKGFYELAKRATVYVGGDTGPTHIAIAAGAPIVGLFGPTEWWRNGSLDPRDICVERTDIACRVDCHRRTCSKWICMDSDVETAFRAVQARLSNAESGRFGETALRI